MNAVEYMPMPTSEISKIDENDEHQPESRQSLSEPPYSIHSDRLSSISDDNASPIKINNDEERSQESKSVEEPVQKVKPVEKLKQITRISKSKDSKILSSSMAITEDESALLKLNSLKKPSQAIPTIPSIDRRGVKGVLLRFFPNGDDHHPGVIMAINELEIKSWEAFLNFLNRQPKLILSSGGIQYVYTLDGEQIRSMNKLENRQSYVVAAGAFTKANYRSINDAFNDHSNGRTNKKNPVPNPTKRSSVVTQRRSSRITGDQFYIFPYSCLDTHEIMILNRNSTVKFDSWLNKEVTSLLYHYIDNDIITHLFAIQKSTFIEIKSFSQLFNTLKITDRFIACSEAEFQHSQRNLSAIVASGFFNNTILPKSPLSEFQRSIPKQDAKLSINWIYGYDGTKAQTKTLYNLSDNEILYVINAVCILYEIDLKQQRFYTEHNNAIHCLTTHQYHPLVASSETISSTDRLYVLIHIWDHMKLETITKLRKEQFGSEISLLSFSTKSDDNFILIVSRDKPKIILVTDWKHNEIIYSITSKSDKILSTCFAFNTNEWITCIGQQYLTFYRIDWNSKPLKITAEQESNVQNIYTGATAFFNPSEQLIVGDEVGSAHIWCLTDNEPRLLAVKESIIEKDVQMIVSINEESFLLANEQNQMKLWHVRSNTIADISLDNTYGSIQSICSIHQGLVIGTKSNYILLKKFNQNLIDVLMQGHTDPSTCICSNQNTDSFFFTSSDRYLYKWNTRTKLVEWSIKSPQLISCATLHPQRNIIILGTEASKLLIYDTLSSCYITTILLRINTGVKAVRFSPDGGDLAVGLKNGAICLFEVLGNGEFNLRTNGTFQNNNLPVVDIIWSVDSSYLLAIYNDDNYNIWSIPSFDIVHEKNIENISWYQMTNPMACNLIGKSIVAMCTSAIVLSPNLIICAGKDGQIRLFQSSNKRNIRTLQVGLGSIQSMIPSTSGNSYLLSINNNPAIVEIQVNIES
ncbi:unnamed protein product [Rotaria magnacalcarata]|uniref:Doublecortin domain-containing protein n=3 Tax=Rotaria magnacalcarata TaxID=392030 RepID=A0A816LR20_9BILA|nr:unnamed protein product [Rotaria magnacalcarata]CAF3823114.1 unnamed protein product [Rotaria magnacalcarata]